MTLIVNWQMTTLHSLKLFLKKRNKRQKSLIPFLLLDPKDNYTYLKTLSLDFNF